MKMYRLFLVPLCALLVTYSHAKNGDYGRSVPAEEAQPYLEAFNYKGTSIEALEGLFKPEELAIFYKLMDFDPETGDPDDNPIRKLTLSYKIEKTTGVSYNKDYGYPTHDEYRNYFITPDGGDFEGEIEDFYFYWSRNAPGWGLVSVNSDGHIVALKPKIDSDSDIELVNSLPELQFLLVDFTMSDEYLLDPSLLDLPKLRSFESTSVIKDSYDLCNRENISRLSFRGGTKSYKVNLDNCSETLTYLYTGTGTRDVSIKNIPNLQYLDTQLTADTVIEVDFETVPNIKAIDTNSFTQRFPGIEKTNTVEFLGIAETGSEAMANQFFGENVRYIDLSFSGYDDYSWLKNYPKLESLDLRKADFDQWDLLPKLESVKHLSLSGIPITDDALKYIAKMPNIQHLNLQETSLTDASALTGLDTLNFLILPETVTSPEGVPIIKQISAIGGSNDIWSMDYSEEYSEMLNGLKAKNISDCVFDKPCTPSPFY
ncbi:leucine-rich repeat domain-containing protein [Salinibius halmophilus]|uniref:hypothetical protein n=1 Tax=Salinibius halmophilus TaxID=1853216 RepID=UPI000E666979|nr:hypothetical protein [Salinibius halmophilus]